MNHQGGSGRRISVGVVGLGQVAREVHLPILGTLPGVSVDAIADPDGHALEQARQLAPRARIYGSLEELLRDGSVTAILVASPTAEHAAQARRVVAAVRALYLEKPLAATLMEGEELVRLVEAASQPAMMGFNYRFHPFAARVRRQFVDKPTLIRGARSVFSIAPRPLPVWKRERASGGGVLLDLGSHHFDLLRFLLGAQVIAVTARIWSERTEGDCCEVELSFDNGVQAHGSYSLCSVERDTVELSGPGMRVVLDRYAPLRYPFWPVSEFLEYQGERLRSPWKEVSYRRSLSAWIDSVRHGSAPPVTLADGLQSLRVVAAAEESARTGRPVSLSPW